MPPPERLLLITLTPPRPSRPAPGLWMISIVSSAFIYTWLYNSTEGSILIVALVHVSENISGALMPGVSPLAYALLNCFAAIILIAIFGRTNLSRRERVSVGWQRVAVDVALQRG